MTKSNKLVLPPITAALLAWYDRSARVLPWRDTPTPYHVWVSEIMLQQTRVEAVIPYFERFITALPSISALAQAQEDELLKLWEGLGYYNRVRNLHRAAVIVMERFGGALPRSFEQLLTLPGIGAYTAGAIASIAYGLPRTAVDGNVKRVIARIMALHEDLSTPSVKARIEAAVSAILPNERVGAFNQALMELGAVICLPNGAPRCENCPVASYCAAYKLGIAHMLPIKTPRKSRRIEQRTIFVIECDNSYAIAKREKRGLLAGLWELPNVQGHLTKEDALQMLTNWRLQVIDLTPLPASKHIFTHIEWHMQGWLISVQHSKDKQAFTWASIDALHTQYALPSAFQGYLP